MLKPTEMRIAPQHLSQCSSTRWSDVRSSSDGSSGLLRGAGDGRTSHSTAIDADAYWPPPHDVLPRVVVELLALHNCPKVRAPVALQQSARLRLDVPLVSPPGLQGGEQRPRLDGSRSAAHKFFRSWCFRSARKRSAPKVRGAKPTFVGETDFSSGLARMEDAAAATRAASGTRPLPHRCVPPPRRRVAKAVPRRGIQNPQSPEEH